MADTGLHPRTLDGSLTVSLVIPVFDEDEGLLDELMRRLDAVLAALPCRAQVVLVDDGSGEPTRRKLRAIAAADARVTLVRLSRNFGHQPAVRKRLEVELGDGAAEHLAPDRHPVLGRHGLGGNMVSGHARVAHPGPPRLQIS